MRDLFCYIDWQYSTSTMTSQWKRIHISKLDEVRKTSTDKNVFTTIQTFKSDIHQDGELQFVPIYFDLDYQEDVSVALRECREFVSFFSSMGLSQEHIRIWFSGSKGFHIVITPELFGVSPSAELTYVIRNACTYVANQLNSKSFDHRVYSIRRMWRMPNSVHQKTKLYCIELSHSDILLELDEIKQLAIKPRDPLYDDDDYRNIEPDKSCVEWFQSFIEEYDAQKELQNLKPRAVITTMPGQNPVCVNDLLSNSIRKAGTRNQAEMALVSYFHDTGVDEKTAQAMVYAWAQEIPAGLTSKTDKRSLEADVKGVVKTIYEKDSEGRYHFACSYIRSLGAGTDRPIACLYDRCPFVKQEDQEPEAPIELKLPEASRAVYISKKVRMKIMVSGREDTPYAVASHLCVECKPDLSQINSICFTCPASTMGGMYEFKFSPRDPVILGMVDTNEAAMKHAIRKRLGIPERCHKHRIKILEYINLIEITAIPQIDFRPDTITEEEHYVLRKGYFVGHDIESNKEYEVTAYTYPDPKTQHLVHVIDEITLLSDDIEKFTADEQTLASLKKFQTRPVTTNGHKENI